MEAQFNRFEFKYPMDEPTAQAVYHTLIQHGMEEDAYARKLPRGAYTVTSLYLDALGADDYYDKSGGFLNRKKIRVRIYDNELTDATTVIALERKAKHNMMVMKRRVPLTHDEYDKLRTRTFSGLFAREKRDATFSELFRSIVADRMRPRVMVRYERTPLIPRERPTFRVTFDRNIEACKTDDLRYTNGVQPVAKGIVIMEIKYSYALPAWFKDIIIRFNLRRDAFSKYSHGFEAVTAHNPITR